MEAISRQVGLCDNQDEDDLMGPGPLLRSNELLQKEI